MTLQSWSIGRRLLIWFLIIALVPLGIILTLAYKTSQFALEKALRAYLQNLASGQSRRIESYVSERAKDAATVAHLPEIHNILEAHQEAIRTAKLEEGPRRAPDIAYNNVRLFLEDYLVDNEYDDMILLSSDGEVILSVKQPDLRTADIRKELREAFDNAKTLLETEISDFFIDESQGIPKAYLATPVFRQGLFLGVVAVRIDNRNISRILGDYAGLGETGESFAGSKQGNEILFVTSLRHDTAATFRKKIPIGSDVATALQNAAQGSKGYGVTLDYRGKQIIAAWRYVPSLRWGLVVGAETEEAFAPLRKLRNAILICAILVLLFVSLLAFYVARSISNPLLRLTGAVQRVSEADLSQHFPMASNGNSRNELNLLTGGFSRMTHNLLSLIQGVKRSGIAVTTSSTQIAAATRQLEATVTEQAAATTEVVATAKEISETSRGLAQSVQKVVGVAENAASLAESGRTALSGMSETMHHLIEATSNISHRLGGLNKKAESISSVIVVISKVADQTNLLSLNAAIEAEKAGDAGLGFGVVATEIRRLADQTAVSALDIERLIKEVQTAVSAGVITADKYAEEVRKAGTKTQTVIQQLSGIIEQVQALTPHLDEISRGMQSQTFSAGQISESMNHLAEAAQHIAESVRELNQISDQLNQSSRNLHGEVSRFTIPT